MGRNDKLKDSGSKKEPFGHDWAAWLAELSSSETIVDSQWYVTHPTESPVMLTIYSQSIVVVNGQYRTQVALNDGTPGERYTLRNHVVTNTGVEDDRSFDILVRER